MEICNAPIDKEVLKRARADRQGRKDLVTEGLEHNLEHIRKIAKELEETYYLGQTAKDSKQSI
ncbi:MAG TPA: hypothetical protein VFR94_06170 [Nitrososphaeraceae archaeon]|nr:hypothetical protein [Nitrososphaeraceae archaeon]